MFCIITRVEGRNDSYRVEVNCRIKMV